MAIAAAAISVGTSLIGSFIGSQSAKSAAKKQAAAQQEAAKKAAETQKELAGNQRDFDQNTNEDRYDANLKGLNISTRGELEGLRLDLRALDNLKSQTAASYALQKQYLGETGVAVLRDEALTVKERTEKAVSEAIRDFKLRNDTVRDILAQQAKGVEITANEVVAQGEDEKSDLARRADREMATIRVAAGERGATTTNSYQRMLNEGAYYRGVDTDRVDRAVNSKLAALENDLVIAAMQTEADLQTAQNAVMDNIATAQQMSRESKRSVALKAAELRNQMEQLAMQQVFDMQALNLDEENLGLAGEMLKEKYDYSKELLGNDLKFANEQSDFVYDQTVIASDAQMDSSVALAMANKNAATSLANTQFLTSIFSSAGSMAGSYFSANLNAKANGLHGIDLFGG